MTTLASILDRAENREKEFVVYRSDPETEVESVFTSHNVAVTHRELPPEGPDPFLVVREGGRFVGALALDDLEWLLAPPVVRPGDRDEVSAGYRVLFDVLDDTVFASLQRRELLAVSREIEDRAFRVGMGTLRVSFQTLSTFESQVEVYRLLAAETDLDVHVYGAEDWSPPAIPGVTYHGTADPDVERHWALAFDGGASGHACALVARERPDGYRGCWTDDPETVGEVLAALADA